LKTAESDLLAVCKIVKAFGVRGDVVGQSMTDSTGRFKSLARVFVGRTPGKAAPATVERVQVGPRGVRLKIAGVNSRGAAEHLIGSFLFVDAAHRVRLPKGRYFVHEIVGLTAFGEDGTRLGVVKDVLKLPAQDVYVIAGARGDILVPAVKEFITAVDVKGRAIRVRLIEGMDEQLHAH
jgi:16S rRNA processing protein RimM